MPTLHRPKPLVRAVMFVSGNKGCALLGSAMGDGDAEFEPIRSYGTYKSREWYEAAFTACTVAYRRLQMRHGDKDVVCTLDAPPARPTS